MNNLPRVSLPLDLTPEPCRRLDTTSSSRTQPTRRQHRTAIRAYSRTGRDTNERETGVHLHSHVIRTDSLLNMASSNQGHGALNRPKSRDSHATVGQFSFAPATTTTTVVTTTTTVTSLAPMRINAPGLSERDPKEYPLAQVRAPESIRTILFENGGHACLFEEAEDAPKKVQEVCSQSVQGSALFAGRPGQTRSFHRIDFLCTVHHLTRNITSLERQDAYSQHVQGTCSICITKPRETTDHEHSAPHTTIGVRPPKTRPSR